MFHACLLWFFTRLDLVLVPSQSLNLESLLYRSEFLPSCSIVEAVFLGAVVSVKRGLKVVHRSYLHLPILTVC